MQSIQQLPLDLQHRPCLGKEDFLIAPCNTEAVKLIDSWPEWNFFAACIYGPAGCGKTHLANVFSGRVSVLANYPYKIPCVKAGNIKLENVHEHFQRVPFLIVEDLNEQINEEAMFHLYNLYRNEGGSILFTAATAPARLQLKLKDLRSRLNIMPAVEIKAPDDELLSGLLVKLFMDRQIIVSPEIISYLLNNMERSFSYARKIVAEIDNISLAKKRAVSTAIVKEAMNALKDNQQGELFSLE